MSSQVLLLSVTVIKVLLESNSQGIKLIWLRVGFVPKLAPAHGRSQEGGAQGPCPPPFHPGFKQGSW